jgi:hypothetical protein
MARSIVRASFRACSALVAALFFSGGCRSGVGTATPTDEAMRAECRARAALQYGMPEAAVDVESPIGPATVGFALPGSVDKGAEGVKTFLCRYSAARTLSDVMATTPDGE